MDSHDAKAEDQPLPDKMEEGQVFDYRKRYGYDSHESMVATLGDDTSKID